MPNYYSDGYGDWFELPDDPTTAKEKLGVVKALVNPTYAQIVTATGKTPSKPKALFLRQ